MTIIGGWVKETVDEQYLKLNEMPTIECKNTKPKSSQWITNMFDLNAPEAVCRFHGSAKNSFEDWSNSWM